MIEHINFRVFDGRSESAVQVRGAAMTVFVGPNNSGKSLALREFQKAMAPAHNPLREDPPPHLIQSVRFSLPSGAVLAEMMAPYFIGETELEGHTFNKYLRPGMDFASLHNQATFAAYVRDSPRLGRELKEFFYIHLDGEKRLSLASSQPALSLSKRAKDLLNILFRNDALRERLRASIFAALGKHLVIDATEMSRLQLRLSERPPQDVLEERGIDSRALRFHEQTIAVEKMSDGIRAYIGILASLYSDSFRIISLDEPEAFLHPPLSRRLGWELASLAQERKAQVLAATHSPDFVAGCIESGMAVNIIRLTYDNKRSSVRLLAADTLAPLMMDPLLRTTGVMAGLFHRGVVVTEAASDRAFYDEINRRLIQDGSGGAESCLYLNAQNKQTAYRIARPLRQLGIPAAIIVDIDILKDGGSQWTNMMEAVNVPESRIQSLAMLRSSLKTKFEASGRNMKRDGGKNLLSPEDQEAFQSFIDQLAEYGVFVVPTGELESWLQSLGATGHGSEWLMDIFERMGSERSSSGYVRPTAGDVWDFVRRVNAWLGQPDRKGIPKA
jgi:ABC-type thiamine transport system ATPase subunit